MGPDSALVSIIVVADFECPACRAYAPTLRALREKYPSAVSIRFVHLPLARHRFALPAARASECAAEHGKFEEFGDLLYSKQDSLGLKSWASFAAEAGIADSIAILRCATSSGEVPWRIRDAKTWADRAGIRGTPTVLVQGWRITPRPKIDDWERIVDRVRRGLAPVE